MPYLFFAQEAQRISAHKIALLERVALPENSHALSTIQKLDELMVLQGRRLVAEFHHADRSHSGGVSGKLQRSVERGERSAVVAPRAIRSVLINCILQTLLRVTVRLQWRVRRIDIAVHLDFFSANELAEKVKRTTELSLMVAIGKAIKTVDLYPWRFPSKRTSTRTCSL